MVKSSHIVTRHMGVTLRVSDAHRVEKSREELNPTPLRTITFPRARERSVRDGVLG